MLLLLLLQVDYRALFNTTGLHTLPVVLNSMGQASLSLAKGTATQLKTFVQRWPSESEWW